MRVWAWPPPTVGPELAAPTVPSAPPGRTVPSTRSWVPRTRSCPGGPPEHRAAGRLSTTGEGAEEPGEQKSRRVSETQKTYLKSRKREKGEPRSSVSQREGSRATTRLRPCCPMWQLRAGRDYVKQFQLKSSSLVSRPTSSTWQPPVTTACRGGQRRMEHFRGGRKFYQTSLTDRKRPEGCPRPRGAGWV